MTFLPVVQRELLVASRSAAIRWQRFGAVALGVVVFLLILITGRATPQVIGERLFHQLGSLLWVLAWLSGPLFTTDALTREKREGTLGLMLLTDLRGYDVVLGKLTATALHQVMLLVGVLPVLALPVALGGISPQELWRGCVSLLLTQGLSLTLGIACSAGFRTWESALRATLSLLGFLTVLPLVVHGACSLGTRSTPEFWVSLGPLMQTLCASAEFQRLNPAALHQWGAGAWHTWVVLLLAFGGALVAFRRQSLEPELDPPAPRATSGRASLAGWRHIHWRDWLDDNPYYWLERACRDGKRPLAFWAWSAIGTVGLISLVAEGLHLGKQTVPEWMLAVAFLAVVGAAQAIKLGLLIAGTRRLGADLRSGALELLLTTPLTPREIVAGCRRALLAEFRPLLISFSGLILLLIVVSMQVAPVVIYAWWWFLGIATTAMLLLDCHWGIDIALRASLREADPLKALRQAVLRLMLPGWLAFGLFLSWQMGRSGGIGPFVAYSVIFGIAMGMVRISARRARIDLEFGLREIASGVGFNTDQMELAEDFRKAAMTWEDRWFTRQ